MRAALTAALALAAGCSGRGCASAVAGAEVKNPPAAHEGNPDVPGLVPTPAVVAQLRETLAAKGKDYAVRSRHRQPDGSARYINRLIAETSPYLLQHANNPVSWYAWGDEPFERARREHKVVFLSIGYSTCHWCHVMERESFEDEEVARALNEGFIAIKVDREERPDLDAIYLSAVQLLSGGGGWPMTLLLTPDRQPFFGGTYFPARDGDRGARPGLLSILGKLRELYAKEPQRALAAAGELTRGVQENARAEAGGKVPGPEAIRAAAESLARAYDAVEGGFHGAPKFPTPALLGLLARYHRRTGDPKALQMVVHTLEKMAAGGIHDHVGGGFHRYSTDARWLVPHFEKMLYDQAQLVLAYLDGYQLTGRDDFAAVARSTLEYVAAELTDERGGFYSASDADSPGPGGEEAEGYFFTWTRAELERVLGEAEGARVASSHGVTALGQVDGRSILHLALGPAMSSQTRLLLYRERAKRAPPAVDRKIVTSWNGLMIAAFARAALILNEPRYATQATRAARFVLSDLRPSGQLKRSYRVAASRQDAFLDDHAFVARGLLDLFQATQETRWLKEAIALQAKLDERFRDAGTGGYFLTPAAAPGLLARSQPAHDGAEPSGNAVAAMNLLRLAELTGDRAYRNRAGEVLSAFAGGMERGGAGMTAMLAALDQWHDRPREVVLVRPPAGDDGEPLVAVFRRSFAPDAFLALARQGPALDAMAQTIPSVRGKLASSGKTTAYVCREGLCELPTSDPVVFAAQLARREPLFPDRSPAPLP